MTEPGRSWTFRPDSLVEEKIPFLIREDILKYKANIIGEKNKINLWLYIIWVSVSHHHIHTHEYTTNTHLPKHALKFYIEYFDLKDKNTIVTTNNTWLHIENACLWAVYCYFIEFSLQLEGIVQFLLLIKSLNE